MRESRRLALLLAAMLCAIVVSVSGSDNAKVAMPGALRSAYDGFVAAMRTGDAARINKHCLPNSVTFTYEKRADPENGQDINTQFAKTGFDGSVAIVRKDAEGCYLVRTSTTAMWFVETRALGWKLYRYLDKPIE